MTSAIKRSPDSQEGTGSTTFRHVVGEWVAEEWSVPFVLQARSAERMAANSTRQFTILPSHPDSGNA